MEINEYRKMIDGIDDSLIQLFCKRMRISADIARHKKSTGLAVRDPEREDEKMAEVASKTDEDLRLYAQALYATVIAVSCAYQEKIIKEA